MSVPMYSGDPRNLLNMAAITSMQGNGAYDPYSAAAQGAFQQSNTDWTQASQQAANALGTGPGSGGSAVYNPSQSAAGKTSGGGTGAGGAGAGGGAGGGGLNTANYNSSAYPTGAQSPGAWWNQLGDYGTYTALQDPATFGKEYSVHQLGSMPISGQGQFLSQFDPISLAQILNGGKDFMDPGNRLAGANAVLNSITGGAGGNVGIINPAMIGADLLKLAKQPFNQGSGPLNPIQAMLQDPDPQTQAQNVVSLLGNALQGVVPTTALRAYMSVVTLLHDQWMNDSILTKGNPTGQVGPGGKNNFIDYLATKLGPGLGL